MTADVGVAGGVSIRGLSFRYGEGGFALSVPELDIAPGAAVACIGPSGCGKTTLLQLIAGILPGRGLTVDGVSLDGFDDAARRAFRAQRIGFVFQDFGLLAHLTVRENILLPYYVHPGLQLDESVAHHVAELARSLGITQHLDRRPERLSQGERQRVAVARALVTRPRLILADEPTGNLDPETAGRAIDLLLESARAANATVIAVTHDHGLLEKFDRVLDAGEWRA